jgi:hypothetical protein
MDALAVVVMAFGALFAAFVLWLGAVDFIDPQEGPGSKGFALKRSPRRRG